jgi:DNA-binding transcriptional regulator YdaS (Cro superfamily)
MDLQTFFQTTGARQELAKRLKVSPNYLWQIATHYHGRKPSPRLARRIHDETLGVVTLESLRPDVWGSNAKG